MVKPHYYSVKEEIMKHCRSSDHLTLLGHNIQIFADISPTTIQRRHTLKPLLSILTQKNIKYWWSFPFRLSFSFQQRTLRFSSLDDGEKLLLQLGLISQDSPLASSLRSSSSKRPTPTSPVVTLWQKQQHKCSKESCPL